MTRTLFLSVGGLLVACLVLATSVSGYFQASHEIAQAGQTTFIICGQDGPTEVTLDRDGNPVEPAGSACGHCADCYLIAGFDVPTAAAKTREAVQARTAARPNIETAKCITRQAIKMPRAPPSEVIV